MITSTSNKQIRQVIALQKKSGARRKEDAFVAEGWKLCGEAPVSLLLQTYVSESFYTGSEHMDLFRKREYQVVADHVFAAMSDTDTPQGVLSVIRQRHTSLEDMVRPGGVYLLLENIQDPGNAGTMLRTGEGAGISGVILSKGSVDMYNPKTIRSTMGSIFRVPFVYVDEMARAVQYLQNRNLAVYAAALGRNTRPYDQPDYSGGCGFVIGNEGAGLTKAAADMADACIRIPMEGNVESLNAAVAAAILMYEAQRQKRANGR